MRVGKRRDSDGETGIAYDSFWQFGTTLPSGTSITDGHTIEYGTAEYQTLVLDC
jgi:mannan endo-1,4-beta-mannosidase